MTVKSLRREREDLPYREYRSFEGKLNEPYEIVIGQMKDALGVMQIIRVVRSVLFDRVFDPHHLRGQLRRSIDGRIEPGNASQGEAIKGNIDPSIHTQVPSFLSFE